ncbi:spore germination protein [Lutispora thermophila]|uniref:Spore germination protein KA n=1 Tax=Lutispora thermophila DSM 19022 TaxID=1122184 RepID=A0A1M6DU87_9FIRM|nr:spore germination protein [Lutispora thermophila]SHI76735.1 spore germination protein KA [Lutispora thermophila DSM 19022]
MQKKSWWDIFIYKEKTQNQQFELLESKEDDSNVSSWGKHRAGKEAYIYVDIKRNLRRIKEDFNIPKNADITIRKLKICGHIDAFLVFIDGLIDKKMMNKVVLKNLMLETTGLDYEEENFIDALVDKVLNVGTIGKSNLFDKIENQITNGFCALFIDGYNKCLLLEIKDYPKRNIEKAENEKTIRGSKESFVEDLPTNISILRRLCKNKNLIVEYMNIGADNNIGCALVYIDGIINPEIPKELKKRINKVKSESILSSGMLEQWIEDSKWQLFPQVLNTERPDRAVSFLIEGKALIIVEGSPSANVVPITFFNLYHTSEDTDLRWQYGTFISIVRLIGTIMAVFLPGFYMALVLYSQEMISSELLASIASAREGVPFPTIIELMVMEVAFELIREASSRVPGAIGETLGIVGALILGQAAVQAGLVSPILIIIVAASGIASYVIPDYSLSLAVRVSRFFFIIMGYMAGFYGISIGMFVYFAIMCSIKSFGVPFMAPVAPKLRTSHDIIAVRPIDGMKYRPDKMNTLKKQKSK